MSLLTQLATKICLAQLEAQGKNDIPLTEEIVDAYQPQETDLIQKGDVERYNPETQVIFIGNFQRRR